MPSADHIRAVFARYVDAVSRGDVEAVVALYAPDARVEDPVGSSPHVGAAAIRAFYAGSAGTVSLELEGHVRVAGREGAAAMIARTRGATPMIVETLDAMAFDDDGRITSMRAYWGPDGIRPAD